MNKLNTFKLVARLVVGSGTATISNAIIRNNVEPTNLIQTINVAVASVVIGSMASEATRQHTDRRIDEIVETWNSHARSNTPDPATV